MKLYFYLLSVFIFTAFAGCKQNTLPSLRETYSKTDSKPFGAQVAFELFTEMYPDKMINVNSKSFSRFREEVYADDYSFYMSVSKNFLLSQAEAIAIVDFVKEGHSVFISAAQIDTLLLKRVDCSQASRDLNMLLGEVKYDTGIIRLSPQPAFTQDSFAYYFHPFNQYFIYPDSSNIKVLGYNQQGKPNFIVLFTGKGRLYLHCEPRAFSNYFLLKNNNHLYLQQALQWVRAKPGNVFWDDYYHKINYKTDDKDSTSALSILFKHPELTIAFWLLIGLGLLYIFFNGKRRQRIIPVIPPVQNASIAYTQALATLYLGNKNNKLIAEKMITYFNEFIRSHYFINMHQAKDMSTLLSKKAGIAPEKVLALLNTIEQVQLTEELSDFELLTLNEQIQYFYKNRN